jgi:hypothetical protein
MSCIPSGKSRDFVPLIWLSLRPVFVSFLCCASVLIQLVPALHNSSTILQIREWTRKSTDCVIIRREALQNIREK